MKVNEYYRASSLEDAYRKLQEDPKNVILAGGLWIKKIGQSVNALIDLSTLGLNKISENEKEVVVGSLVTQREFENSKVINSLYGGAIAFATREVMGVNFRNIATIGGSIMGRYPFSDVISGLLPYDVELEFYPNQVMSLEDYLGYKGKLNSILVAIHIKKEKGNGFFKKVKTTALDFPIINFGVSKVNGKYTVVVGNRPAGSIRATKAMEYINNVANPSELDYKKAAEIAASELAFMDNKDASAEYRKELTKVYVKRGLMEVNK